MTESDSSANVGDANVRNLAPAVDWWNAETATQADTAKFHSTVPGDEDFHELLALL